MADTDYVPPEPPAHLHKSGRETWTELASDLEIEDLDDLRVLTLCCEAFDRVAQARRVLRDRGLTWTDAQGGLHVHPAVAIEARSASRAAALIKQLQVSMLAFERLQMAQSRASAQQDKRGRITRHGGGLRRQGAVHHG
jgi:P27 family predicted phage terminase small subunit